MSGKHINDEVLAKKQAEAEKDAKIAQLEQEKEVLKAQVTQTNADLMSLMDYLFNI